MAITISKIFHANVYLGATEHLGRASEVKLPELNFMMQEHKGLGMLGTLELPSGLQAMTMAVKWGGFYAEHMIAGANPFTSQQIQIRANHETYGNEGRIAQVPLVVTARGGWKKLSPGTFKPGEASDYDHEVAVSYYKLVLDGQELYEIDVHNNIWRVDGVDVLEQLRANLGG